MKKVKINVGRHEIIVVLRNTDTANAIYKSSPFTSNINIWGKEIYFDTNIKVEKEYDSKQIIDKGEIAFWVEGSAIAIGFGPTPVSVKDEIRLVTDANIFGDTNFEVVLLEEIKSGETVSVEKCE
tara:strand:+ start:4732 stop:5106 length:375 start_codon:yes stop_codon:yes gene_type:complete